MIKRFWNKPECIKEHIEKLDYKLYRYYSFGNDKSNHSLDNLNNNYVYFCNPNVFNDPFDSNIGASLSASFKKYSTILKEKHQSEIIGNILVIINKTKENNEYTYFWKSFMEWFSFKHGQKVYFFDVLKYLYYCRQHHSEAFNQIDKLAKKERRSGNVLNEYDTIDVLLNYRTIKKFTGVSVPKYKNSEITSDDYVGPLQSMYRLFDKESEDITDAVDNMNKHIIKLQKELNEAIFSLFKVACFSEEHTNILMWSHYANKHTGFCVEYDLKEVFSDDYDQLFAPVVYSERRVSVVGDNKRIKMYNKKIDKNSVYGLDSIFTKSKMWSYEKEWRKVIDSSDNLTEFNSKIKISKIYIGARISDSDKSTIIHIARDKNIPVFQMVIDNSFYKLTEKLV